MIEEGSAAPEFRIPADDGSVIASGDLRGGWTVLYFYPKDDTSGCTTQACEFRDLHPRFEEGRARILGVSPDSVGSHVKFRNKHGLNFTLLADEDKTLSEAYGVWKEKSMYGRKYMGVERSTFLIDPDGKVARVWRKVRPAGHAEVVAEALDELKG